MSSLSKSMFYVIFFFFFKGEYYVVQNEGLKKIKGPGYIIQENTKWGTGRWRAKVTACSLEKIKKNGCLELPVKPAIILL